MTLGGLACRGHPGDDATVESENDHQPQPGDGQGDGAGDLDGAQQIAVPRSFRRCASALCSCPFLSFGVAKLSVRAAGRSGDFSRCWLPTCGRAQLCRRCDVSLSAEDEYQADLHAGEKMGFFRRYQQLV